MISAPFGPLPPTTSMSGLLFIADNILLHLGVTGYSLLCAPNLSGCKDRMPVLALALDRLME
jgi:hypothetical protein